MSERKPEIQLIGDICNYLLPSNLDDVEKKEYRLPDGEAHKLLVRSHDMIVEQAIEIDRLRSRLNKPL